MKVIASIVFVLIIHLVCFAQYSIYAVAPVTQGNIGQYKKFEAGLVLTGSYANPYDPEQVSIEVEFTSPLGKKRKVYAFYYKEFSLSTANQGCNGTTSYTQHWAPAFNILPWRVRFAPDELGVWTYQAKLYENNNSMPSSTSTIQTFTCITSVNPGYLKVSPNKRYLQFANNAPYFAIGENLCWYNGISSLPATLAGNNCVPNSFCSNTTCQGPCPTENHSTYAQAMMTKWLNELADNGGNYTRIWMYQTAYEIEWETLGNYEARQNRAWELDRIIELCESKNIYVHLVVMSPEELATGGVGLWLTNPYNTIRGVNGVKDFFSSSEARKYFKRKLRYIISRWGYSTNIAQFELFNEVDFVDVGKDIFYGKNDYGWDPYYQFVIGNWINEMANYIKSNDERKLISFSPAIVPTGDPYNSLDVIDITSTHSYGWDKNVEHQRQYLSLRMTEKFDKPHIIGEYGFSCCSNCWSSESTQLDLHNTLWSSAFSNSFGAALPWFWDSNHHNECWGGQYKYFKPLSLFWQGINVTQFENVYYPIGNSYEAYASYFPNNYSENPPPDAPNVDINGFTNCSWAVGDGPSFPNYNYMARQVTTSDDKKIGVFALKNNNEIIGWVHNKSNFWWNLPNGPGGTGDTVLNCNKDFLWEGCGSMVNGNKIIEPLVYQTMTLGNMRCNGIYNIKWYSTYYDYPTDFTSTLKNGGEIPVLTTTATAVNGELTVNLPPLLEKDYWRPFAPDYGFIISFDSYSGTTQGRWEHSYAEDSLQDSWKWVYSNSEITALGNSTVFYRGLNNRMQHYYYDDNSGWHHETTGNYPENSDHYVAGDIEVGRDNSIFYRGNDGWIQRFYYDNEWKHEYVGPAGQATWQKAAPDTRLLNHDNIMFYKNVSGRICHYYWNGSGFSFEATGNYPDNTNHYITSDLISGPSSSIYYRGADGWLQRFYYNNGWQHEYVGGSGQATWKKVAPDSKFAVFENSIFYKNVAGRMCHYYWTGSGFGFEATGNYPENSNHYVTGEIIAGPNASLYYRGADGWLQRFYYNSGWIHEYVGGTGQATWKKVLSASRLAIVDNAIFYENVSGRICHYNWNGNSFDFEATGNYPETPNHYLNGNMVGLNSGYLFYRGNDQRMQYFKWSDPCVVPMGKTAISDNNNNDTTLNGAFNFSEDLFEAKVYPNPFETQVEVELTGMIGQCEIKLLNINGLEMMQDYVSCSDGTGKYVFHNMEIMPSGIYFLMIMDTETGKLLRSLKLVKVN